MNELNEQIWGVRINEKHYCKFDLEAPDWVKDCENNSAWYSDGVVVWDESQKIVVNMHMWAAMSLLDHLRSSPGWKTQGQDVTQEVIKFRIPLVRKKRRKAGAVQEPEQTSSQSEKVVFRLHLSPERIEMLLRFLSIHDQLIRSEGEMQKRRYKKAMGMIVELLLSKQVDEIGKPDNYEFSI